MSRNPTSEPRPGEGPVLVYMVHRGMGDVVWHTHATRGIAALTPEKSVVYLCRPSTQAREVLLHDPSISRIVDICYRGGMAKHLDIPILAKLFRAENARAVWILRQTNRPLVAAFLAGVPQRRAFGDGPVMRLCLSRGPIAASYGHQANRVEAFRRLHRLPDIPEPWLFVGEVERATVRQRFASLPRPWIVYGLGSTDARRIWPWERFVAVADRVGRGTALFLGAASERAMLETAAAAVTRVAGIAVHDLKVSESMALIEAADALLGNDSGPLNLAAGVGTPAVGVFGPTYVPPYSRHLHAVRAKNADMLGVNPDEAYEPLASVLASGRG